MTEKWQTYFMPTLIWVHIFPLGFPENATENTIDDTKRKGMKYIK